VQKHISGDRVAGVSLHCIECPSFSIILRSRSRSKVYVIDKKMDSLNLLNSCSSCSCSSSSSSLTRLSSPVYVAYGGAALTTFFHCFLSLTHSAASTCLISLPLCCKSSLTLTIHRFVAPDVFLFSIPMFPVLLLVIELLTRFT